MSDSFFHKDEVSAKWGQLQLGWRMAIAKDLLKRKEAAIAEVARRVGYSSASTFNVAFTRYVGVPPGRYVREQVQAYLAGESHLKPVYGDK